MESTSMPLKNITKMVGRLYIDCSVPISIAERPNSKRSSVAVEGTAWYWK
jgi:hypothetical protein